MLESDESSNDYVEAAKHLSGSSESGSDVSAHTVDDFISWEKRLEETVRKMLGDGKNELMNELGATFERILIKTALSYTRGRKNEAAVLLGIGRNTITRKIAELGLDDDTASR